jgi:hypothetical protein
MEGLPLVPVKMEPIDPEEIVHEYYHHGRVVGTKNPNRIGHVQTCMMFPAGSYDVVDKEPRRQRMVGFTKGHTSYEWTEPID